jgi:hypothetical protein
MAVVTGATRQLAGFGPISGGLAARVLQTVVRESARLGEAFSYARTIVEHDPEGMGAGGCDSQRGLCDGDSIDQRQTASHRNWP